MRRLLNVSLLLLALFGSHAMAQEFSTLEERMSEAEFKAAGLDKLSPEELANLNTWLSGRVQTGGAVAAEPVEDRRGFRSSPDEDDGEIVSSIAGEFRGWRQKGDRFVLTNGQVWEVTDSTQKFVVKMFDPVVRIKPGSFSAWFLTVDGHNSSVKVKRVK